MTVGKKIEAVIKAVFFSLLLGSCSKTGRITVNTQYPGDTALWNHTFKASAPLVMPDAMPRAMVIPHHDICIFQQNSFYAAVSQKGRPSVIVILCPDHFECGTREIVAPDKDVHFVTVDGEVPVDRRLLKKLAESPLGDAVEFKGESWIEEHGIFIQMPFIRHYFPETRVVPLLLKPLSGDAEFDSFKRLAEFLDAELPEDALLVASVDFSHYQIPEMTELHDQVSMNTIANFESPRDLEIDSPESIFTLMEFCRLRGALTPVLLDRTSTYDFVPDEYVESTSHQYWTFYTDGEASRIQEYRDAVKESGQRYQTPDYSSGANFTIVAGGSGDVKAGFRTKWTWDRYRTSSDPGEQNLYYLAGKEARFLSGFDAYIFDPEPGSTYTRNAHGTTFRLSSLDSAEVNEIPRPPVADDGQNHIELLVLNYDSEDYGRLESEVKNASLFYDIIIKRDGTEKKDAEAVFKSTDGNPRTVNLGILKAADSRNAQGSILCVNWRNGEPEIHTFDYQADGPLPPAIHQAGFPE